MKSLLKIYISVAIFVGGSLYAENMGKKQEGYRIEVVVDTVQREPYVKTEQEIRFISPDGKIVKRMEKYWGKLNITQKGSGRWITEQRYVESITENAVLLWTRVYETPYNPEHVEGPVGRRHLYTVELLNKRGEIILSKEFIVYPPGAMAIPYWKTGISRDGSTIFVYYRDSLDIFHIEIYDTTGRKLAGAEYPHEFNYDMQISPDGKIFGATTFREKGERVLFFLDVETGRTKIVRAEGEYNKKNWWRAGADLDHYSLKSGEIRIGVFLLDKPRGISKTLKKVHVNLTFDEIPDDLSILLQQGGEK
jgi:hypothetical protein